jgi:hypothetical protein
MVAIHGDTHRHRQVHTDRFIQMVLCQQVDNRTITINQHNLCVKVKVSISLLDVVLVRLLDILVENDITVVTDSM